jgi:hypothetical protein
MAFFQPGKEITNKDGEPPIPTINVEGALNADNKQIPLSVGKHLFELVVLDDSQNPSQPAIVQVNVIDTQAPTAIINFSPDLRDPQDPRILRVPFGRPFTLDGRASTDIGGQVVRWTWKLVE